MFWQHCQAPFHLAKAAAVQMRKAGKGSIVYLSSISAKYGGSPSSLHYAAAKAAAETTMRGLSRIHAGTGIRINSVRSGFVDTPQQRSGRTPEQIKARIEQIPMGRAGTPEDIASAFVYLFSDESSFVTGRDHYGGRGRLRPLWITIFSPVSKFRSFQNLDSPGPGT